MAGVKLSASDHQVMARMIVSATREAVAADEKEWTSRVARHFKREWQHGGLKKTAVKIGVGAGIGVITVTASALTGGFALPVILAVAAGAYGVGQMTGTGTAVLWGRSLKGAGATRGWMDGFRKGSATDQKENMFALEERVHKTIRRSLQHYRKAARKFREELDVTVKGGPADCATAWTMVQQCFSVDHHLHKSQVYLEPSVWLLTLMLDVYDATSRLWQAYDAQLEASLEKFYKAHKGGYCGSTSVCLFEGEIELVAPIVRSTAAAYTPWDAGKIKKHKDRLKSIGDELLSPRSGHSPPTLTHPTPGSPERLKEFYRLAGLSYRSHAKSPAVKFKHYFANAWARKTTGERVGFGVGQGFSVAGSAAGGAIGGVTAGLDLADWCDPVIEIASEVVTNTVDWANEKAVEAAGSGDDMDVAHHAGATHVGSESQESLQKAAIHLNEAVRRLESMKGGIQGGCDSAEAYAYAHAKAEHHLRKTETHLAEAIKEVKVIGKAVNGFDTKFAKNAREVYRIAHRVVRGDHANCGDTGRCFAPRPTDSKQPKRPVG